jgi:hypothetical protein
MTSERSRSTSSRRATELALLALTACAGAAPPPIDNRGGAPPVRAPDAGARLEQLLTRRGLDVHCLSIDRSGDTFEVRELHERPCPGNPDTFPVIGWFRVRRDTIEEFDRQTDTWKRIDPR